MQQDRNDQVFLIRQMPGENSLQPLDRAMHHACLVPDLGRIQLAQLDRAIGMGVMSPSTLSSTT